MRISKEKIQALCELRIKEFIDRSYEELFGRMVDISGKRNLYSLFAHGKTKEELLLMLFESEEAYDKGVVPDEDWLNRMKMAESELIEDTRSDCNPKSKNHSKCDENDIIKEDKQIIEQKNRENNILELLETLISDVECGEGSKDSYYAIDYFDFENKFRGDRAHIKEVQSIYLPYFEGRKNVLDLGCGRGEFTELLIENGIGVTGVDSYFPYVQLMKELGLPVAYDDAIGYLKNQNKVDGIFMGQVVEHMPVEKVIEICHLAYEKLGEGDYLIMETPNPASLAIYTHAFYLDPSHNKPVHPFLLKYIAEKAGFTNTKILYTDSSRLPFSIPEINSDDEAYSDFNNAMRMVSNELYGSQDYALIACR